MISPPFIWRNPDGSPVAIDGPRYNFDIETNGLLDATDRIHSICIEDLDTGVIYSAHDHADTWKNPNEAAGMVTPEYGAQVETVTTPPSGSVRLTIVPRLPRTGNPRGSHFQIPVPTSRNPSTPLVSLRTPCPSWTQLSRPFRQPCRKIEKQRRPVRMPCRMSPFGRVCRMP